MKRRLLYHLYEVLHVEYISEVRGWVLRKRMIHLNLCEEADEKAPGLTPPPLLLPVIL